MTPREIYILRAEKLNRYVVLAAHTKSEPGKPVTTAVLLYNPIYSLYKVVVDNRWATMHETSRAIFRYEAFSTDASDRNWSPLPIVGDVDIVEKGQIGPIDEFPPYALRIMIAGEDVVPYALRQAAELSFLRTTEMDH